VSTREISNSTTEIPDLMSGVETEDGGPANLVTDYIQRTGITPAKTDPPYIIKTRRLIEEAHQARLERGEFGGLTLGSNRFHQLNTNWCGIDKGVHIVGGDSNLGKSALMRMFAWDIAQNNPNAHVRFYTLDDAEDYFLSCFVAQAAKVPINAVDKPHAWVHRPEGYFKKADYERMVDVGDEMYQRFLSGEFVEQFSFIGQASLESVTWRDIRDDIRLTKAQVEKEGRQLVVFIDNFHDIDIGRDVADKNEITEGVATETHKLADQEGLVIFGTVELRKNQQRRPILDDINGSRKFKYKARSVILLYSEVGVSRPNPRLYYEREDQPAGTKASVLELHFAKSKGNDFKGRLFYHQITEMGLMKEVSVDQAKQYMELIA
jgi:replicative DNA helicase